jgi:hypothetical protein
LPPGAADQGRKNEIGNCLLFQSKVTKTKHKANLQQIKFTAELHAVTAPHDITSVYLLDEVSGLWNYYIIYD